MTNRTVTVSLKADIGDYARGMNRAEGLTSNLDRATRQTHRNVLSLSKAHTLATGIMTGAVGALVVSSVKAAANFDVTMRQIAVATNQPLEAIGGLRDLAMKMGQDTVFSAQDAGQAMLELAKSGLSEAEIRAGALASTLTLASAGSLQLADSASYVTTGLALFHLKADQSAAVAAALAGGANAARGEVSDLGMALAQVGPGAANAGLSLQETTGILALFAKNGILGSDAGTSLKTMLASLTPHTAKQAGAMKKLGLDFVDAKGNFKDIADVADQLHAKLGPLSESQRSLALNTIFGSDASRAAAILMREGGTAVRDFTKATSDRTQAEKLAAATTSGAAGALSQLSGSIDTAKLQLGEALTPLVIDLADHMTGWANGLSNNVIPALANFVTGMENGTGPGGEFVDVLKAVGDAGEQAWHLAKPIFSFIGDHPHLFAEVAKDAALLAVSVKAIGAAKGLSSLVGLGRGGLGAGGGGGLLGSIASMTNPIPVFVTNDFGLPTGPGGPKGVPPVAGPPLLAIPLAITAAAELQEWQQRKQQQEMAAETARLKALVDNAVTPEEIRRSLSTATQIARRSHVSDLGNGQMLVDPKMDANVTTQGERAVEAARELRRKMNAAMLEQDRMEDPKYAAAAGARAQAMADATGPKLSAAAQKAGRDLQRGVVSPIDRATTASDALLLNIAGLPDSKLIKLLVTTHVDDLGRQIINTGGNLYVQGRGGKLITASSGGLVTGPGTSTSDSIPARLSDGEFVVNAEATGRNLELLRSLNSGTLRPAAYTPGVAPQTAQQRAAASNTVQMPVQIYGTDNTIQDAARHMAREVGAAVASMAG